MFDFGASALIGYVEALAKAMERELEPPRKKRQAYRDGKWVIDDYG